MKKLLTLVLILLLMSCGIDKESPPALASVANTGELDTTFNGTGYIVYNGSAGGSTEDIIYDLTTDSQGRTIAVGTSTNVGGDKDLAVWRLNTIGALDTSFSGDGIFIHDNAAGGNGDDVGFSVAVNSADEIFISGHSFNGSNFDMAVWKLTSSGALDSGFSGDGIFTDNSTAGGNVHDQGTAITIDNSGRPVIAGYSDQSATNRDLAVWRLTTSGAPDNTFSGNGRFTDDGSAGGEDDNGTGVRVDSSNNIIVVGRADSAASLGDMAVWKLSDSGVLDTSFSSDGFFSHNSAAGGDGFDSATDIVIDGEGKYFISGYSRNSDGNNDMVIWKMNIDGSFDTTFSADGMVVFDLSTQVGGSTDDTGEAILIDSNNRVVVAGTGNEDMCIWRYDENGELDTDFNTDGFFSHDSAAGGFDIDAGHGVSVDSSDRIYIGGSSENASSDFDAAFWRLK